MNEKKRNTIVNAYFAAIVVALAGVLVWCTAMI